MLSTLSRFQRALTPETVARHQPRGGGRQSDGTEYYIQACMPLYQNKKINCK